MKRELVQCDYCKSKVSLERCEFATQKTVIDGKEYVFCCAQCAQRFKTKGEKKGKTHQ